MRPKVAVTGASGFVGKHVVRALAAIGADVTAVARTEMGDLPPGTSFARHDMNEADDAYGALGRPDVVIHLAWGGLPNYHAPRHFADELPRQYRFLSSLIEGGLKSLVIAGTCLEYGMQFGPLSEDRVCLPSTAYALAKHTLHQQLALLQKTQPFSLTWARLFYVFGDGQAERSLWSQFQLAVASGAKSFDMSGGEQLRDFIPIETAAHALAQLALRNENFGAVNICSGHPRSVRSLVEQWVADSGSHIELNLGRYPYPDYEPMAFWGTSHKLLSILGQA